MTRVQKDVVSYFPHDANACTGDTLTVLQSRFGNDGYAFWFKLLEKLALTDGHCLDVSNPTKWQIFIARMGVDEITTVDIMKILVEMNAIDKDLWASKLIWCQNLVDNVSDVYKNRKRELPQKPLTTDKKAITTDMKAITTSGKPQSKVKYSKVNKNIYIVVFDLWNSLEITKHKQLTDDTKRAIGTASKDYSEEEICQAIKNYAEILKGDQYYFKYTWTLKDFLKRGMEKFLDLEIARQNYLEKKGGQDGAHRQGGEKSSTEQLKASLGKPLS